MTVYRPITPAIAPEAPRQLLPGAVRLYIRTDAKIATKYAST